MFNPPIVNIYNSLDTPEVQKKLDKILAAVQADTTAEKYLSELNDKLLQENIKLKKELEDMLTGEVLPITAQNKIKVITQQIGETNAELQAAIDKNKVVS